MYYVLFLEMLDMFIVSHKILLTTITPIYMYWYVYVHIMCTFTWPVNPIEKPDSLSEYAGHE